MKRGNHMKKILSKLQKIEDFILFLTFVIMILGAFAQVLNRNIFITHSFCFIFCTGYLTLGDFFAVSHAEDKSYNTKSNDKNDC